MSEPKGKGRGRLFSLLPGSSSTSETRKECTESSTSSATNSTENEQPASAPVVRSRGRGVLFDLLTKKVGFPTF